MTALRLAPAEGVSARYVAIAMRRVHPPMDTFLCVQCDCPREIEYCYCADCSEPTGSYVLRDGGSGF